MGQNETLVGVTSWTERVIETALFEKFILTMIILNVIVMASEHYGQSNALDMFQTFANYAFVIIFNLEMLLKICSFGLKKYCEDNFNLFDAIVNILSVIDIMMPDIDSNMLAFRAVRLLRIFKIVKTNKSVKIVLSCLLESMTAVSSLMMMVLLFCFSSAMLCKQFFSGPLYEDADHKVLSRYTFSTTG